MHSKKFWIWVTILGRMSSHFHKRFSKTFKNITNPDFFNWTFFILVTNPDLLPLGYTKKYTSDGITLIQSSLHLEHSLQTHSYSGMFITVMMYCFLFDRLKYWERERWCDCAVKEGSMTEIKRAKSGQNRNCKEISFLSLLHTSTYWPSPVPVSITLMNKKAR